MKIVVLDGYGLNPGDLSWSAMEKLGELTVYDRTAENEFAQHAAGAHLLLTNKTLITEKQLNECPTVKYIGVLATGYNVVDVKAASERGIIVTNIPAYGTPSVAQMVYAHLLTVTNRVEHYAQENRNLRWSHNTDFCYWDTPLMELCGKTMGIVGLGHTGMATARIALAFGMKVLAFTSKTVDSLPSGIEKATLDELFTQADIISLHCPLTPSTQGIINADSLQKMRPQAIIINTGRGPLVDEQAVANALQKSRIKAYCADVLCSEPPAEDNPLWNCTNAFITPHIAWATLEARERLMHIATQNIQAFLAGSPINRVQ